MRRRFADLKTLCLVLGVFAAGHVWAESEIRLAMNTIDVAATEKLGTVEVSGIGTIDLVAVRKGGEVVIRAVGPTGQVIGKAQATAGLRETPIYVQGRNGLEKINIRWGVREPSSQDR